jgi:hypothetical protein
MSLRPLAVVLIVQILIGIGLVVWGLRGFPLPGGGDDEGRRASAAATRELRVNRFDAARAFRLTSFQTEQIGPRPAGSDASARLRDFLVERVPRGRTESIPGHPELRNVVGHIPGRKPAILIGAHYDTEARPVGHLGANDGAAGTAVVMELARQLDLRRKPSDREIRFVLFDGEEEPAGCEPFIECGLRGSKAYAQRHADEIGDMILLDYVGNKDLTLPREGNSDRELWERLRDAARRVGSLDYFPATPADYTIVDDHVPFLEEGVTAIDLIDFSYEPRDTLEDTLDKVSPRSLDAVGETVLSLVLEMRGR